MAECTSDASWLQAMLDTEAALASVEAEIGLIPLSAAEAIARACDAGAFDVDAVGRAARFSGNPVVPLVAALRQAAGAAGDYVHLGATSQDILDTAAVTVIRRAADLVLADLQRLAAAAAILAERHRATLTVARTLLQQAVPTTFGMKAAGWLNASLDAGESLSRTTRERLAVQLGGAAGTLAALGSNGPAVLEGLGGALGLPVPLTPWHSDRSRLAEIATSFAMAAAVAGKIALDVSLLMQTEIGEAFEPAGAGRGISSAMPQKRNPALSITALASARRAAAAVPVMLGVMIQAHERGLGTMQAEWLTLTELLRSSAGAVASMAEVLEGLEVDESRMRDALVSSRGLVMAERVTAELVPKLGRDAAVRLVEEACGAVAGSGDTVLADEVISRLPADSGVRVAEVESWVDPAAYLGSVDWFIDRVLARHAAAAAAAASAD
jgi:3-carboxy-cis,cis-muconate cycloisomerase